MLIDMLEAFPEMLGAIRFALLLVATLAELFALDGAGVVTLIEIVAEPELPPGPFAIKVIESFPI